MNYYKIIQDDTFVGVATSYDLRRFQQKHRILLTCEIDSAQYIQFNDILYRDNWFSPIITDSIYFEEATIIVIEKDEYDTLCEAMETGKEIEILIDEPAIEDNNESLQTNNIDEYEKVTKEFLIKSQINELKRNLLNTDYVVIKIAEQVATFEEYSDIIEQRKSWRKEINELMDELNKLAE